MGVIRPEVRKLLPWSKKSISWLTVIKSNVYPLGIYIVSFVLLMDIFWVSNKHPGLSHEQNEIYRAGWKTEKPGGFCQITNFFSCRNINGPVSAKWKWWFFCRRGCSARPQTARTKAKNLKAIPLSYFDAHAELKATSKTSLDFSSYIIEAIREKLERDGAIGQ